jgi:hypothetical protein
MRETGSAHLRESLLKWLPSRDELAPYVAAISAMKDFQSSNEELIEAARLLNDCAVLEYGTVAYLAARASGSAAADPAAVRRALQALKRQRLADNLKAQRVLISREKSGDRKSSVCAAHPVPGRMSYWYRTGV